MGILSIVSLAFFTHAADHFQFRFPQPAAYRIEEYRVPTVAGAEKAQWLRAWPDTGSTNFVEFGNRVVLQLESAESLENLLAGHPLKLSRKVASNLFILQAPDALTAAREAHRLATVEGVLASHPVVRNRAQLHGPYAPEPTDYFFSSWEWTLENRNADGSSAGVDVNVRAAWPYTTGKGVTVAISDNGIELTHPELVDRVVGAPHYNFIDQNTNGAPTSRQASGAHGTEVAGLLAASRNNYRMVGVAPDATLASWVVIDGNGNPAADEQLMDMYQYQSNVVGVINLSWGNNSGSLLGPDLVEQVGISNAVNQGRSGLGVVMVRSAGNTRAVAGDPPIEGNANDNGYGSDPQVIGVAAVRMDGRVASYSSPGACVLVAAPSADTDSGFTGIFTTDLLGTDGANALNFFSPFQDMNNYVFGSLGFTGTSAAAPHVSGIVALMLSANPTLSYRDVQQILILSSRHFDFADPDLMPNGAGFLVSHNDGFGVPDADVAVSLARDWPSRPSQTQLTLTSTNQAEIPDDGLRVLVTGNGVPTNLASIHCQPSTGPHADVPTPLLPLVDFGFGTNLAGYNLTNAAALIERGGSTFANEITLAAQAGAAFAVIYNYDANSPGGGDELTAMGATDFVPIPTVFIGHTDGINLLSLFQSNSAARAQIHLDSTNYVFTVTNTLLCEHVGLRVMTDHQSRSDVRITLLSPMGTRSILERLNTDFEPGPVDWTYYSTHHFFETTAGTWTACFSDESPGNTGTVQQVSLILTGVPIHDRDRNGLDDFWEITYWDSIFAQSPKDDPDLDGYSNAREQLMDTDPTVPNNIPFSLDLSWWNQSIARLSWPGSPYYTYEIRGGTDPTALTVLTNVPGHFPVTEWFTPYTSTSGQFYRVRAFLNP